MGGGDTVSDDETGALWGAFGRDAAREPGDVRTLLSDLYGANRRGGVNARAAAADLGVSERTVQRWVKADRLPENANGQRARADWHRSADVRAGRMNSRRESRLRSKGTTIRFTGVLMISRDKRRRKDLPITLTGEQAGDILDALLAGNDEDARLALEDAFGDALGGDVELAIEALATKG